MNLEQAEKIYKHPKGHSKAELTECLKILNSQPRRLSILEQVVIADAHNRLDILNGVIDAEYTIKEEQWTSGRKSPVLKTGGCSKGHLVGSNPTCSAKEEKKLLICGDRNWKSKLIIKQYIEYFQPSLVIEGECRGADIIAREVAKELNIPLKEFPANWNKHGKAAGPIRNREMLDEKPDLVLAFHSDIENSKGTADTLCEAEDRGITYALIGV